MTLYNQLQDTGLGGGDSVTITFENVWVGPRTVPSISAFVTERGVTNAALVAYQAQLGTSVAGYATVTVYVENQSDTGSDSWLASILVFDARGQAVGI